jgi:hypothetical protein
MPLNFTKSTMKRSAFHGATLLLLTCLLANNQAQDESFVTSIGRQAAATNPRVYQAVDESVRLKEPKWRLLAHQDSAPGTAYWEWQHGKRKLSLYISFMASEVDAARRVKYTLAFVELPAYRPLNIGDEGYVDTHSGWALLRVSSLVIQIDARKTKADTIKAFAEQIAIAARAA